jgi:hypothetical protein
MLDDDRPFSEEEMGQYVIVFSDLFGMLQVGLNPPSRHCSLTYSLVYRYRKAAAMLLTIPTSASKACFNLTQSGPRTRFGMHACSFTTKFLSISSAEVSALQATGEAVKTTLNLIASVCDGGLYPLKAIPQTVLLLVKHVEVRLDQRTAFN